MISKRWLNKYCCEDISVIENYNNAITDKTQSWDCHHRLETHNSDGELRLESLTVEELKALNMYYNRPASELIFLTSSEHISMHGSVRTTEFRKNISNKLKGFKHSSNSKKKIADNKRGKHFYTNGVVNIFDYECPEGFRKGMIYYNEKEHSEKLSKALTGHKISEEEKRKISETLKQRYAEGKIKKNNWSKGTRWYNNGIKNICAKECPEGFTLRRIITHNKETIKK